MMEFHVSRKARDQYQFDQDLYALSGNVIFANFHATRLFAQKINQKRDLVNFPENAVKAGQINAMGMIDEIMHLMINLYRQQINPHVMEQALEWANAKIGTEAVDRCLLAFADQFPPLAVYRRESSMPEYLAGSTEGIPNRQILVEEMCLLWLTNSNPAMLAYADLFDDSDLRKETAYLPILAELDRFFDSQPPFGPDHQNLITMLHSPAVAVPYSLSGQLEYIRQRWGTILGKLLYRVLGSLDLIKEEERLRFSSTGPVVAPVIQYNQLEAEPERFSPDQDWMPRLVMIAKNTYVWLDQLSKKYQLKIYHLDQIPDEELDGLSSAGFTGLWLIGLWERSAASQQIKQLCGNPEAVASAYSLASYEIAGDLGGEEAYRNLKVRAWQRGIRLASDMVPNHMGIDSQWVMDHPDWFISLDYSPFPSYSFNGPDVSNDSRVGIFIEDHYFSRSDAAVVFKRVDHQSGREQYIYHGNDGTSMPWNDTAQLNYLNPQVREAVIQTIIQVARQFPVIRFDAAMTLAKKHYQRLWFPEPGTGGAIPSRAEYGMTKEQFDAAVPIEFWREVVDRVAREVPDTLLLAEAFWLMEGYFVRTLGMHRVYNSAFMNMLRNEENANYRTVMKNTLEFDPEILKRFVNFMNNPDERTAVDQFGKGDKYFGICTIMATLPGLPMLGHGQIEGFAEKYGMEFRRPYWNEQPDPYLVQRHEKEIFPLFHRRYLFAGVENFLLYDFFTPEGMVNEDVFAYSNGFGSQHALVVYQNKFASTRGWVRTSVPYSVKSGEGEGRKLIQKSLGEGLGLHQDDAYYCIFREHLTGMEYIRSGKDLISRGLYIELEAYKCVVYLDFREVQDDEWHQYAQLALYLNGRGVPSIEEAMRELFLAPIHQPFRQLVNANTFRQLIAASVNDTTAAIGKKLLDEVEGKLTWLLHEAKTLSNGQGDEIMIAHELRLELEALLMLPALSERFTLPGSTLYNDALTYTLHDLDHQPIKWVTALGWIFVHKLGKVASTDNYPQLSRSWIDEWLLGQIISSTAQDMGIDSTTSWQLVNLIRLLTMHQMWFTDLGKKPVPQILDSLLKDSEIQRFLDINRYKGALWFNKESFETLVWWLVIIDTIQSTADPAKSSSEMIETIIACYEIARHLLAAEKASGYQVEKLVAALNKGSSIE
jgi:glycosidase